jgi:signal transduction histidine kinase
MEWVFPKKIWQIILCLFSVTKAGGTGLGPAIAYGLSGFGRPIDVTSKINEGTCFTMKLPIILTEEL